MSSSSCKRENRGCARPTRRCAPSLGAQGVEAEPDPGTWRAIPGGARRGAKFGRVVRDACDRRWIEQHNASPRQGVKAGVHEYRCGRATAEQRPGSRLGHSRVFARITFLRVATFQDPGLHLRCALSAPDFRAAALSLAAMALLGRHYKLSVEQIMGASRAASQCGRNRFNHDDGYLIEMPTPTTGPEECFFPGPVVRKRRRRHRLCDARGGPDDDGRQCCAAGTPRAVILPTAEKVHAANLGTDFIAEGPLRSRLRPTRGA